MSTCSTHGPKLAHDGPNVAAIILAAGFSTRMGAFKPLLELGGQSVLECVVSQWRASGVERVIVVGGYRGEEVEMEARSLGAAFTRNERPEDGMFSSFAAGASRVLANDPQPDFVAVHPVDIPLIRQTTIEALLRAAKIALAGNDENDAAPRILLPSHAGEDGHPPLVRMGALPGLLAHDGENGLKGAFARLERELGPSALARVPVDDPFLNLDLDTPEDLELARRLLREEHDSRP